MTILEYLLRASDELATHPDQSDLSRARRARDGYCPTHERWLLPGIRCADGARVEFCPIIGCDYHQPRRRLPPEWS